MTQTLERFNPGTEAIEKDDVKFYEYLISTAIFHERASLLYKESRSESSFASDSKKTGAGTKPPVSGRGSTKNNPCLRSGLKLGMESLKVLKVHTMHVCKDTSED